MSYFKLSDNVDIQNNLLTIHKEVEFEYIKSYVMDRIKILYEKSEAYIKADTENDNTPDHCRFFYWSTNYLCSKIYEIAKDIQQNEDWNDLSKARLDIIDKILNKWFYKKYEEYENAFNTKSNGDSK